MLMIGKIATTDIFVVRIVSGQFIATNRTSIMLFQPRFGAFWVEHVSAREELGIFTKVYIGTTDRTVGRFETLGRFLAMLLFHLKDRQLAHRFLGGWRLPCVSVIAHAEELCQIDEVASAEVGGEV